MTQTESEMLSEMKLRELLAHSYASGMLYTDDEELQDTREKPFIDFLRDNPFEIERKIMQRGRQAFERLDKADLPTTDWTWPEKALTRHDKEGE